MASKYLQKYPIPQGFQPVLHDFARQVLRDQPTDIIDYAVKYFQAHANGTYKQGMFKSKYNIPQHQSTNSLEHKPVSAHEQKANAHHQALPAHLQSKQNDQSDMQKEYREDLYQRVATQNESAS